MVWKLEYTGYEELPLFFLFFFLNSPLNSPGLMLSQITCYDHRFDALLSHIEKNTSVLEKILVNTFYYITEIIWSIDRKRIKFIYSRQSLYVTIYLFVYHTLFCLHQGFSLHGSRRPDCILWEWTMLQTKHYYLF